MHGVACSTCTSPIESSSMWRAVRPAPDDAGHAPSRAWCSTRGTEAGTTGAVGPSGTREKDVTLDVVFSRTVVAPVLTAQGLQVMLTRSEDTFVSLEERTARANAFSADLFVSIHCNASESKGRRGVEAYILDTTRDEIAARVAARENATSQAASAELASILGGMRLADEAAALSVRGSRSSSSAGRCRRRPADEIQRTSSTAAFIQRGSTSSSSAHAERPLRDELPVERHRRAAPGQRGVSPAPRGRDRERGEGLQGGEVGVRYELASAKNVAQRSGASALPDLVLGIAWKRECHGLPLRVSVLEEPRADGFETGALCDRQGVLRVARRSEDFERSVSRRRELKLSGREASQVTSPGAPRKLAVVSWSSWIPVSKPSATKRKKRVSKRRPSETGVIHRANGRSAARSRRRPRASSSARRVPSLRARRWRHSTSSLCPGEGPSTGRMAASSSASRHAAMAGPRRADSLVACVVGHGHGGVTSAPQAGSRSAGSSLPPGNTTAPPRNPPLLRSTQKTSRPSPAALSRTTISVDASCGGVPARFGSRSNMRAPFTPCARGAVPPPRAARCVFERQGPRPATTRRAPVNPPRTRAPS